MIDEFSPKTHQDLLIRRLINLQLTLKQACVLYSSSSTHLSRWDLQYMVRLPFYGLGTEYETYEDLQNDLHNDISSLWNILMWQLVVSGSYIHNSLSLHNIPVYISIVKIPAAMDSLYTYWLCMSPRYASARRMWDRILATMKDVVTIRNHYVYKEEQPIREYTDEELMNIEGVRDIPICVMNRKSLISISGDTSGYTISFSGGL